MPRYIDTDEFEKRIKPYDTNDPVDKAMYNFAHNKMMDTSTADVMKKELYDRLLENANIIAKALNKYQTADMVEVVRCKYCKHYDFSEVNITPYGVWYRCKATGRYTPQIHYCGFGDRREDG